jgi:hypothetical protein
MRRLLCFLSVIALLAACGGSNNSVQSGTQAASYNLLMFSTPRCEACESLLPAIDKGMTQTLGARRRAFNATLYILTGANGFGPPDQSTADEYKAKLGISFNTLPDIGLKNYQVYYGAADIEVPGIVVTDLSGTILQLYPNNLPIDADSVIGYLNYLATK